MYVSVKYNTSNVIGRSNHHMGMYHVSDVEGKVLYFSSSHLEGMGRNSNHTAERLL